MISDTSNENKLFTPVAVFAGIVEVCGLIVLPSYSREVQDVFLWFLMFFPALVVLLFFATFQLKSRASQPPASAPRTDDERMLLGEEKARLLTADPGEMLQNNLSGRSEHVDELVERRQ